MKSIKIITLASTLLLSACATKFDPVKDEININLAFEKLKEACDSKFDAKEWDFKTSSYSRRGNRNFRSNIIRWTLLYSPEGTKIDHLVPNFTRNVSNKRHWKNMGGCFFEYDLKFHKVKDSRYFMPHKNKVASS